MRHHPELELYPIPEQLSGVRRDILEIIPAIDDALWEIENDIGNGLYGLIVGDDTSGRIPTLILRGVINQTRKQKDMSSIPTIFIQGRGSDLTPIMEQRLIHALKLHIKTPKERALIVTEYMMYGLHVKSIGEVIHSLGKKYNVITTGQAYNYQTYIHNGAIKLGEKLLPSSQNTVCPKIHGENEISGLTRRGDEVNIHPRYIAGARQARLEVCQVIEFLTQRHSGC